MVGTAFLIQLLLMAAVAGEVSVVGTLHLDPARMGGLAGEEATGMVVEMA
jgi:hypothetical protein